MVERANGKLKQLVGKTINVKGGSWQTHLSGAVEVYNRQYNRTTGYAPEDAVVLDKSEQEQVKKNVAKAHVIRDDKGKLFRVSEKRFDVGDKVRVKLNKGKLDKSSVPNWSTAIYKVTDVIRKQGTRAERYKVDKKGNEDKNYTRNDLLKVDAVEKPAKPVETRGAVKTEKESNKRVTRSVASKPTTRSADKKPTIKKTAPKAKFRKGDKVRVQYPDATYDGVVRSSTAKRTMVYFDSDKTVDEFLPSEYNSIEIIKKA